MAIDSSKVQAARRHVEDTRQKKFSIGAKVPNPLTQDLHNAVTRLSSELYTKDIHFLMELIQVIMPLFFSMLAFSSSSPFFFTKRAELLFMKKRIRIRKWIRNTRKP